MKQRSHGTGSLYRRSGRGPWRACWFDHGGIRRERSTRTTDRALAQRILAEHVRRALEHKSGLRDARTDRLAEHAKRPLLEHVDDWAADLHARGVTPKHAAMSVARVRRVLEVGKLVAWADVTAAAVTRVLAELRDGGLSLRSLHHYARALTCFARWAVADRRVAENPLAGLAVRNVQTDVRHARRALTDDELRRLLHAAEAGPVFYGMPGEVRALVYRLAVETGLRLSELRSLTWASFDLGGTPPTVTVSAAYAKSRRTDSLPLKHATAALLAHHATIVGPVDPQYRPFGKLPDKASKMIRVDLAAAGVPYRTPDGVADFHSLRHTCISNLARSGVAPKVAQQLARHSTIALTLDRYTHVVVGDLATAVERLPDLDRRESVALAATGTDDRQRFCQQLGRETVQSGATGRVTRGGTKNREIAGIPEKNAVFAGETATRRGGFEPPTFGSVDRCSIQLS